MLMGHSTGIASHFAAVPSTSTFVSTAALVSSGGGGGISSLWATEPTTSNDQDGNQSKMIPQLQPRAQAAVFMTIAMALHFGGYEFARSASLALFTSSERGFTNAAAFPFAIGLVSPFSIILLMLYGNILDHYGPRVALRRTTLLSIAVLALTGLFLSMTAGGGATTLQSSSLTMVVAVLGKILIGTAFVFSNSYAHLLYTQQWSFLGSIMTSAEGSAWFSSIAGLSSLVCTVTGSLVAPVVSKIGLIGLLSCNCITLTASLIFADCAYGTAQKHGFDPAKDTQKKHLDKQQQKMGTDDNTKTNDNAIAQAVDLFERVPTLGALFQEVLSFQSMSTLFNVCMVRQLKTAIPHDSLRAAWTGKFFSWVNAISALMQFVVLPVYLRRVSPMWIWRFMPILPVACSLLAAAGGNGMLGESNSLLWLFAGAFFCSKTMDYSIRNVIQELVYQPLDFESRYKGKEIIGVFASRFGKSGISMILSVLSYATSGSFGIPQLSCLSVLASMTWWNSTWRLSALLPRKKDAEKNRDKNKDVGSNKVKGE